MYGVLHVLDCKTQLNVGVPQNDDAPDFRVKLSGVLSDVQFAPAGATETACSVMSSLQAALKEKVMLTGALQPSNTLTVKMYDPATSTTTDAVLALSLVMVHDTLGLCIDDPGAETTDHWYVSDDATAFRPDVTSAGMTTRVTVDVFSVYNTCLKFTFETTEIGRAHV